MSSYDKYTIQTSTIRLDVNLTPWICAGMLRIPQLHELALSEHAPCIMSCPSTHMKYQLYGSYPGCSALFGGNIPYIG